MEKILHRQSCSLPFDSRVSFRKETKSSNDIASKVGSDRGQRVLFHHGANVSELS